MYETRSCFFLCSGLAESLFSSHREDYVEIEQASLTQLFQYKVFDTPCGSFLSVRIMGVFVTVYEDEHFHSYNIRGM